MLALFGIGPLELAILLVIGLLFVGAPIVALVFVISLACKKKPTADPDADVEPESGAEHSREARGRADERRAD